MEHQGFTLWMTGLSGAGKTTIAKILETELHQRGIRFERLDGDVVRESLTKDLGFSKEDRDKNIERVTFVAKLLSRNNVGVVASFISPYRADRQMVRNLVDQAEFLEVFIDTPVEDCIKRDPKGLYAKARAGQLKNFTGVDAPYEEPEQPEIHLKTIGKTPAQLAKQLLDYLVEHKVIGLSGEPLSFTQEWFRGSDI